MRVFSSSALAALVILALFLGNCFSCPQVLLSLATQSPHGCCHRNQPVKKECQTQSLQHFVKADFSGTAPEQAVVTAIAEAPLMAGELVSIPDFAELAPPDLLLLHSALRI